MSNWYYSTIDDPFYDLEVNRGIFDVYIIKWIDGDQGRGAKKVIRYVNMHQWDIIKEISIIHEVNDSITVRIKCSVTSSEKLTTIIKEWFKCHHAGMKIIGDPGTVYSENKVAEFSYGAVEYHLSFNSPDYFLIFRELLEHINLRHESCLFTSDIMDECVNTAAFCNRSNPTRNDRFQHNLPALTLKSNKNKGPLSKSTGTLVEFLWDNIMLDHLTDDKFIEFQHLLTQGEDVNKLHPVYRFPPLAISLMFKKDRRVPEHLIYYHADPTRRDTGSICSALDYALSHRDYELANILMLPFTNVERPIKLKVKNIEISFTPHQIRTDVDFYQAGDVDKAVVKSLTSELKKKLEPAETNAIFRVSKQAFEMENDSDQSKITSEILRNLAIPDQIFEIIRDGKSNMIGYSLFELIKAEDSNKLYWHCNISIIDPEYRQTGIMTVLIMRHAHALRALFPDKTIGIYYLAVHPNSYRLANNHLHWPMYQPEHMQREIELLLKASHLKSDSRYHHDGAISCFVDNQIVVREALPPRRNFHNDFFYRYVLGQGDTIHSGYKSTPVLFFVCDASYEAFHQHSRKIGINIESHLALLACALRVFLSDIKETPSMLTKPGQFYLQDSKLLFWHNKSTSLNAPLHSSKCFISSKL